MKKQRFLFALFMAIVMMAMSPGKAWADYLEIYSPNDELLRTVEFENGSATADLEIGQVVLVWLDMDGLAEPVLMYPLQKEYFGKEGKESIKLQDSYYGSLNVSTTGNYKFTVTQKYTNFVEVGDPEMGYTQEYAGAEATISITCNRYVEHVHVFDQENIYLSGAMVTAPTCTEEGLCKYSCLCSALGEETFVVSAKGHNFSRSTEEIAVPATCTTNAYCKAGCTRCDAVSDTETLEVFYTCLGHDWHADADGVHHTCQREGCGIQEEHAFVEGEKNEQTLAHAATCTSGPQYYKQCSTCGTISHDENDLFTSGASLPHNWGDDDKCTVCYNDFCDFGEYKDAIINYGKDQSEEITLAKTDTEAKKIHIVAGAQIYVQLNGQEMSTDVTPESGNVNIENGSYEINLRMDDNNTQYGIFVQEEGDYLISLRRPVVNESKIEYDNDNWETVITHASCILCIEHAHAYENGACINCGYVCQHANKTLSATADENGLYHYICDVCQTESENGVIKSGEGENAPAIELMTITDEGGNTTYTAASVAIADGEKFQTPVAFTAQSDHVSVNRTFTVEKPGSVMLPFSVPASQISGAIFYEFGGVSYDTGEQQWVATMKLVDNVVAYKPYLVVPTSTSITFGTSSESVNFLATSDATNNMTQTDSETGWTFKAVNAPKTWSEDDSELGKAYGFAGEERTVNGEHIAKGQFVKLIAGATAAPGRSYLTKENADWSNNAKAMAKATNTEELPSKITVRFIDGETTGISIIDAETGELTPVQWYDMNGRKIEKPAKGGLYIKNNKKIMVK